MRRARAGHLFLDRPPPVPVFAPPHQTIWRTFSACLHRFPRCLHVYRVSTDYMSTPITRKRRVYVAQTYTCIHVRARIRTYLPAATSTGGLPNVPCPHGPAPCCLDRSLGRWRRWRSAAAALRRAASRRASRAWSGPTRWGWTTGWREGAPCGPRRNDRLVRRGNWAPPCPGPG